MIDPTLLNSIPSEHFLGKDLLILQDDNKVGVRWNKKKKLYEKWYAKFYPLNTNIELEQVFVQLGNISNQLCLTDSSITLVPNHVHGVNNVVAFIKGWEPTDKIYVDAILEAKNLLSNSMTTQYSSTSDGKNNYYNPFHTMFGIV